MSRQFISAFLCLVALIALVRGQSQSGFISIDCGLSENSGYTDKLTGLNYTSDATLIETGVIYNISSVYSRATLAQQFLNVRSFLEGARNCYTLKPARGNTKFLIRASFMYGNYDGQGKPPSFDIILEADVWDSIEFEDESTIVTKEIIHIPQKNFIYVCLVNKGSGTPFISALELRPLKNSTYTTESGSLSLFRRWDIGSRTSETFRYPDDIYDRIWLPNSLPNSEPINTTSDIISMNDYQGPSTVMQTAAIMNIKSKYGVKRNWQGDPCVPIAYLWQGLNCSYPEYDPPRITSLNLSSSGIAGDIAPYISTLTSIQILDLSNNNLTGPVPDFLSQLPFLTELNLKGTIPNGLIEKQKNGLLSLSVEGNPDLCPEASCTADESNGSRDNKFVVPVVASVVSLCVLVTAMAILWSLRRRMQGTNTNGSFELKNQRFSYSNVLRITNNFERVLGNGGFGTVYHGYLDGTEVAVKMLSPSSAQGYKQFQAEVELLMRIHHKNLTTLVGYCDEGTNRGLIYEFMANGNLQALLLGEEADILSWEGRLRIAIEAAKGLEYLHSGCTPPIVHRDVKSTNILLSEKFQAKIADFGLSRTFPVEGSGTHVTTTIAGTPGYFDPAYYISNRLTEKSDVYNFGVVLLEIITSKSVIERTHERTHITQWVSFMLGKGDIESIVDPRLLEDFDINSVWKTVEIAMACVSQTSTKRPTMNQVVMELNESLAIETARLKAAGKEYESKDSIESISVNQHSELSPLARQ
ncbi:putative leucine-rich repeat receptor-like protein kinase At2g19210 [Citrus sinensis]|uniref:putative leucine-rich repeat receptor-like protein kinase At2g19210 n=1 Tax=Citrus sinensis TaxID=2711 RepID=UPI002277B830|nr:putative leucine-rich repeat receptor-like protein kinase At2g19210 [Citrus sinensis]